MTMLPGQGPQFPFNYPTPYSPGQMAFTNNAEMSQLITMFAGPLMGAMAGPGNFMPHMMPGQALMDQFAMRNYQNQTRMATFNLAGEQNNDVANRLLGLRTMATGAPASEMNREQAMNMAGMLNNPFAKAFMGMAMGPENVEAMLHGRRGDVQNLGNTINRVGYFQKDPTGGGRMDAGSLEDLTTGVFSHLYEPQGDVTKLAEQARAGGSAGATATAQLQKAAAMEDRTVVSDTDLQGRLQNISPTRVDELYKKYVQGGTATDTATQAKELTKFNRAVKEARVLDPNEVSVGQLEKAAYDRPTDEMHGLMAGQVSQLHENLFQRGVLPPGVGNLDTKGKVGAIAETKLDSATIDRLAQKMAERDLADKDAVGASGKKFSQMTETEQQDEIKKAAGTFKTQIEDTKRAADDVAAGRGTKSAEDVMQMGGAEALAGNVDASRTASRLKEYTDSIAAVRDIFGDNGNPNAPMPALMAALDQLTQGAMGSMNPATTASTLRTMQTLARETGTGMQQLATMSQQAGAMGQQLGIMPSITMQNVAATMGITKAAQDRGAFSNQTPGAYSKEEFQQEALTRLQAGDASDNAKSMAALNRIYQTNKKKYAGTELEAAMAAYNDPTSGGKYKFDPTPDKPNSGDEIDRNLYEDIGKGRAHAARALLLESGGDVSQFESVVHDKRTHTEEFMKAGRGFLTQKHDLVQNLNAHGADSMVGYALEGSAIGNEIGDEGINIASSALTEMVLDSSNMGVDKQLSFMEKHMESKIAEKFEAEGMDPADAKTAAQKVVQQTFGDGKGGIDRSRVDAFVGNIGTVASDVYDKNTVQLNQLYNNADAGMSETAAAQARAKATSRMVGHESTPTARISDYFMDIGKRGEKFNLDSFLSELAPVVGDRELLNQYAGEMGAGLHTLSSMRDQVEVSQSHVDKLAKEGKIDELKKLGGVGADEVVVSNKTLEGEREKRLKGLEGKALADEYAAVFDQSGAHLDDEEKRAALAGNTKFNERSDAAYMTAQLEATGKAQMTEEALKTRAMRSVGTALEGKEGQQEDIETVQRALYRGKADKDSRAAGLEALGRVFKDGSGREFLGHNEEKVKELAGMSGEAGRAAVLKELGISEEDFTKGKSLDAKDKTEAQKMAEVLVGFQSDVDLSKVADEKTATSSEQKQRADKVDLQATNVYINGAKTESGAAASSAAAGDAAKQKKEPTTVAEVEAEMAQLEKKKVQPVLWGKPWFANEADKKRYEQLEEQRGKLLVEQEKQKTKTDAASEPKTADSPLPDSKTAAAPPPTATPAGQASDTEKTPDAPLPPAKTTADAETAKELKEKTDAVAVQATAAVTHDEAKAIIEEEQARQAREEKDRELPASAAEQKAQHKEEKVADQHDAQAKSAESSQRDQKKTFDQTARQREILSGAANAEGNALAMHLAAQHAAEEAKTSGATTLPQEKTAAVQQAAAEGRLGSANVQPGAQPGPQQQTAAAGTAGGEAGGGSSKESITLGGTLRLEGLHEAILEATGDKGVQTPSGGPTVVGGVASGKGALPSGNKVR